MSVGDLAADRLRPFDRGGDAATSDSEWRPSADASVREPEWDRGCTGWLHRLALVGDLVHCTAALLEAEIDHLCEAGVDGVEIDLSRLSSIDTTGAIVLAQRSRLCRRRGVAFELIAAPAWVDAAFDRAGLTDQLPPRAGPPRPPRRCETAAGR